MGITIGLPLCIFYIILDNHLESRASRLLYKCVDLVAVLHIELLGSLVAVDSLSVVEETNSVNGKSFPLAVSIHELSQRSGELELEQYHLTFGVLHLKLDRTRTGSA